MLRTRLIRYLTVALVWLACAGSAQAPSSTDQAKIARYISEGWQNLSRSMSECKSVVDLKVETAPVLYLPADEPMSAPVAAMHASCGVDIRHLPRVVRHLGDVTTA